MAKPHKPLKGWQKAPPPISVVANVIPPRESFCIVCEGKQTEKNYFQSFRATKAVKDFEVHGLGQNTLTLVQSAIKIRSDLEAERGEAFDQSWCVFDRDSFKAQTFNSAIELASKEGFRVAYSNESFEIWYLLHFYFHQAAISRDLYEPKLSKCLEFPYKKNSPLTYSALQQLGNEDRAVQFAAKLLEHYVEAHGRCNPEADNPSTTVHLLVLELRNRGEGREFARD